MQSCRRFPKPLQVVVLSCLVREHMDHKIHVVEQYPLGLTVPFDMSGVQPHARESLLYLIRDGLDLARVATADDDKIISEGGGFLVHLQDSDVFRLLRLGGADCLRYPLPQLAGPHLKGRPSCRPGSPSLT